MNATRRTDRRPRAKRTEPDNRRAELLEAAVELAKEVGYRHVTRALIAARCDVCETMISRYHSPMSALRAAIVREGIRRGIIEIIAEAVMEGDPQALKLPKATKDRVFDFLWSRVA